MDVCIYNQEWKVRKQMVGRGGERRNEGSNNYFIIPSKNKMHHLRVILMLIDDGEICKQTNTKSTIT